MNTRPTTNDEDQQQVDDSADAKARRMGWKPKDEYTGNPEKWVPAEDFLKTGFDTPAILAERYKILDDRFARSERERAASAAKLDEAVGMVGQLTGMMRTSEQRAYDRAKKDLEAERTLAVERGDKEEFARADKELEDLRKTAPAPAAEKPAVQTPTEQPAQGGPAAPEVLEFYQKNPWYVPPGQFSATGDMELSREADMLHIGLRNVNPTMPLAENLKNVEQRLRQMFPAKFGGQRSADNNERREEAASVTPSSGGGGRPAARRDTFESMPKESKDAFTKYAKMLEGKGEPLSKDEWAKEYWAQFADDGR